MGKLSEILGVEVDNQKSYQDMVSHLKLALRNEGTHNLFVAVCDDINVRETLLRHLRLDLKNKSHLCDLELDYESTDISKAIREKIKLFTYAEGITKDYFLSCSPTFSVNVADELSDGGGSIAENEFYGGLQSSYLEWEQGKNKEFEHPTILWVNSFALAKMKRKAPDYCAHVKSFFYFDFD